MKLCAYPVTTLATSIARHAARSARHVTLIDDFSRCEALHRIVEPLVELVRQGQVSIVDSPLSTRGLRRILERCDVLVVAWHPGEASMCTGRVLSLATLSDVDIDTVHVISLGSYAWTGEVYEGIPRVKPRMVEYAAPLAATLLAKRDALNVIIPVLIGGVQPEPFDWISRGVWPRGANLEVLHVSDAGMVLTKLILGNARGWRIVGGVVVREEDVKSTVRIVEGLEPKPPLTGVKPEACSETCRMLSERGFKCTGYKGVCW